MEKHSIRDAEQRTQTICLLILSAIGIGVALLYLRQVLVPFVLAAFLTMAVTPILDFMRKKFHLPRGMAIGVTIMLASFVLVFLGALVSTAVQEVIDKRQAYVSQVGGLIEYAEETVDVVVEFLEDLSPFSSGAEEDSSGQEPDATTALDGAEAAPGNESGPPDSKSLDLSAGTPEDGATAQDQNSDTAVPVATATQEGKAELEQKSVDEEKPDNEEEPTTSMLQDMAAKVPAMFRQAITWVLNSVGTLMSQGLLVLIFMMFLITGYRPAEEGDAPCLRNEIRARVKEYLRVKIAVSTITGVSTYVILRILGVDLALVFGLAAFFLNFIPNIGSLVAVLLPVPVVMLAPPTDLSVLDRVLAMLLPGLVQFLMGNILEPRWMGKSLDLNPIVILISLIFWGVLWGPVGMLLSVPITAVLKMLLERSDLTQPVAALLSEDG